MPASPSRPRLEWALLLALMALAAWARLYQLDQLPPGLYTDEAYYALDALDVLAGARPVYLPANNGREPLFVYALAASIGALGRTPLAVRLPAVVFGLAAVAGAYALGRALYGGRVGLLTAALAAGSLWAIALSRLGLRAGTLPALGALMLAATVAAWRTRRAWHLVGAGLLLGLCAYTYLAARLIPLPLAVIALWAWWPARRAGVPWRALALYLGPAALVAAPLAAFAVQSPEVYFGRVEQVAILDGGPLPVLKNALAVAGAFLWQGDLNSRHNLPGRPVFDPVLGLAFCGGVGLALFRAARRRDLASGLILAWTATMLIPTLLSDNAPHFLRAAGALPVIFLFPALALEALWQRYGRWMGAAVVAVVAMSMGWAMRDYFGPYARDPNTSLFFQTAAVRLAEEGKGFLEAEAAGDLWIDGRLWDKFPAVRFLLPEGPRLRRYSVAEALPPALSPRTRVITDGVDGAARILSAFQPAVEVAAQPGAPYRNDLEQDREPYPLYNVFTSAPVPAPAPPAIARLANGVHLQRADIRRTETGYQVTLTWWAPAPVAADIHSFVHLRLGDTLLTQADEALGGPLYPAPLWRPGDWVTVTAALYLSAPAPAGAEIWVGLYHYPSGERVALADGGGEAVRLPVPER